MQPDEITRRALLVQAELTGPDKPCSTAADFARRIGIQPQALTKWQAGTKNVTAPQCARIASEFNVNGHWLFTGGKYSREQTTLAALEKRLTQLELLSQKLSSPSIRSTSKTSSRKTTKRKSTSRSPT